MKNLIKEFIKKEKIDLDNHWCRYKTIRKYPQVFCSLCNPINYSETKGIAPIIPDYFK